MSLFKEFEKRKKEFSHIPIFLNKTNKQNLEKNPLFYHMKKYSKIQVIDVYKFILQGAYGWFHLFKLGNEREIKTHLENELFKASKPIVTDELFELLDKENLLGRLNLRVWKNLRGDDRESIWNLMQKAKTVIPSTTIAFREKWKMLYNYVEKDIIAVPKGAKIQFKEWLNLVKKMEEEIDIPSEMPLVSHSPMFRKAYKPCYRLVNKKDLKELLDKED